MSLKFYIFLHTIFRRLNNTPTLRRPCGTPKYTFDSILSLLYSRCLCRYLLVRSVVLVYWVGFHPSHKRTNPSSFPSHHILPKPPQPSPGRHVSKSLTLYFSLSLSLNHTHTHTWWPLKTRFLYTRVKCNNFLVVDNVPYTTWLTPASYLSL